MADRPQKRLEPEGTALMARETFHARSPAAAQGGRARRRAEEAYLMYQNGATLEEVGQCFGLTRERVRQIFQENGFAVRGAGAAHQVRRERQIAEHSEGICDAFAQCKDVAEAARRLDLPKALVKEVVEANFAPAERRKRKATPKKYSDDELIGFLREASRRLGGVLTAHAYTEFARGQETPDGRSWPTHQTHALRFGSWRAAVTAAGLAANPSSPIAGQTLFEPGHCIDALRAAARQLGRAPTADEYEEIAKASGGAFPSQATVRNRLGTWHEGLGKAGL